MKGHYLIAPVVTFGFNAFLGENLEVLQCRAQHLASFMTSCRTWVRPGAIQEADLYFPFSFLQIKQEKMESETGRKNRQSRVESPFEMVKNSRSAVL